MIIGLLNLQTITSASKDGLFLWLHQIVPTLLPFTIISYLYLQTNIFGEYYFIFSILSGFFFGVPLGSKLAIDGYHHKLLNKEQAQALCNFCNNLSPAFVLIYVFNNKIEYHYPKFVIIYLLYLFPFICLCAFLFRHKIPILCSREYSNKRISVNTINSCILNSFQTMIQLCGYIVLFSILTELLGKIFVIENAKVTCFFYSVLEITRGITSFADANILHKDILVLPCLCFTGISCILQTLSIIKSSSLSAKAFLKTKMLLTLLCGLQAALLLLFRFNGNINL